MIAEQLIALVHDSSGLNDSTLKELKELTNRYPYFDSARLLLLKNKQLLKHIDYNHELKIAAVHVNDRKKLYHYLIQPTLTHLINEIDLDEENKPQLSIVKENIETKSLDSEEKSKTLIKKTAIKEMSLLEKEIVREAISSSIYLEASEQTQINEEKKSDFFETEKILLKEEQTPPPTNAPKSFSGWLQQLESKPKPEAQKSKKSIDELMQEFIEKEPRITPNSTFFSPTNMARLSLTENDNFVTETLAKIYAKQGNIPKAIKAYKNLSLKYPEKKDTFDAFISDLEKQLKK